MNTEQYVPLMYCKSIVQAIYSIINTLLLSKVEYNCIIESLSKI